jgi:hypothetical protein
MLTANVLFSVQGVTIKPLVERIKIKTAHKGKPTLNESIHSTVSDEGLCRLLANGVILPLILMVTMYSCHHTVMTVM